MEVIKIQTKKVLTQISNYFSSDNSLTKPETRTLRDMTVGILKSKTVLVNRIAASLREHITLKKTVKRLSDQYLKDDFAEKVRLNHLENIHINQNDFLVIDGSDIIKKYAKQMEGLELVRDGDTGEIGYGFNFININAVSHHTEITPMYSKAYSFEMGTYSRNKEIKEAVQTVTNAFGEKGAFVIDREADGEILKDFFFSLPNDCIIRLKKSTKVLYKSEELQVSKMVKKMDFVMEQQVTKVKKNRRVKEAYQLAAVRISFKAKNKTHQAWLVVTRNKRHGGLCYLLVKTDKATAFEVADWAFKGYGKRWKIEEYHRHIKQSYGLEDIQIRTFRGLQSMLAVLVVAMYILYKKTCSLHIKLLLESGYNYLNKNKLNELTNFIYYKLSKIISHLLMPVKLRWRVNKNKPPETSKQLNLNFN